MDPEIYYNRRFREHFNGWVEHTRAHAHPGEGTYISIQDLNRKNLSHIPQEDMMLFHCALACTVLIDQVMYTYFKADYPTFQKMTLYPKIEYGITNINVNPWDITHSGIGLTTLERFTSFFVKDLREFFSTHSFELADWHSVRSAMLNDRTVTGGPRGEIFKQVLEESER